MMRVCHTGCCKMPYIVNHAVSDIRHRLWTLYWLVRMTEARMVVELGVRQGDSTRALLAACEDVGARLFSFDIEPDCYKAVRDTTRALRIPWFDARWSCEGTNSILAGKEWGQGPVDLVFVDTDHTVETTRQEIAVWQAHVRIGGCLVFHDYWLTAPPQNGVKTAVDEFHASHMGRWNLETHDSVADGSGDTGFAILWKKELYL
jgi:predicted O-methyltransferase YrrM